VDYAKPAYKTKNTQIINKKWRHLKSVILPSRLKPTLAISRGFEPPAGRQRSERITGSGSSNLVGKCYDITNALERHAGQLGERKCRNDLG